jgi:L-ascorbate metabolism protein UlaG (beta-lactamase superfamily)
MTAPLFTNPFLPRYSLGRKLKARLDLIDAFVRDVNEVADGAPGGEFADDLGAVRLILSGHAHYDHLMDVPALAARYMGANPPHLLTSLTGKRTLGAYKMPNVVALNEPGQNFCDFTAASRCDSREACETPDEAGRWWPAAGGPDVGPIRVFAAGSDHPPQLGGTLFWPGCHASALAAAPTKTEHYRVGEVLAFLIDFLDSAGGVAFRIYYEDAPLSPCRSEPFEKQVNADGHAVDLALLCTGNWKEVKDAETIVFKLRARDVILHHWEWFFDETPYRKRVFLGLPGSPAQPYRERVAKQLEKLGIPNPDQHVEVLKPGVRVSY